MKNVPGQGKVREFNFQSGKFRKNEKSQGISKISKKLLVNWLLVFHKFHAILEKGMFPNINCKQFKFRNIPFLIFMV